MYLEFMGYTLEGLKEYVEVVQVLELVFQMDRLWCECTKFSAFLAETLTVLPCNHSENSWESEFLIMLQEIVNLIRLVFFVESHS